MFYASELENKTTFKFKALLVQKLHVGSRLINSLLAANRKKTSLEIDRETVTAY